MWYHYHHHHHHHYHHNHHYHQIYFAVSLFNFDVSIISTPGALTNFIDEGFDQISANQIIYLRDFDQYLVNRS